MCRLSKNVKQVLHFYLVDTLDYVFKMEEIFKTL
jgi:hypothetical protein